MGKWNITGVHHISLKPTDAKQFEAVLDFYHGLLDLPIQAQWKNAAGVDCAMLDLGNTLLELVTNGKEPKNLGGGIDHIALHTDRVDDIVEAVRQAGFDITVEPRDGQLGGNAARPIRIAFFRGPLGELVELFRV